MMTANPPHSRASLQALCDCAVNLERTGDHRRSLDALELAIAALAAEDRYPQYLYEWRARLQRSLGEHAPAEESLQLAAGLALRYGNRPAALRMMVARAENALAMGDGAGAEELLGALRVDGLPLGPVSPARLAEILAWLRALRFPEDPQRNLSVLRCEAALVIAALWMERGKYRSALTMIRGFDAELPRAGAAVRLEQVRLLEAELAIEAGELRDPERLAALDQSSAAEIDQVRVAVVRARLALASGRLAPALNTLPLLAKAPAGDPQLFAAAAAAQVSFLVELNRWKEAEQRAGEALAVLGDGAGHQPLRRLLERARASAEAHGRSLLSVWELPTPNLPRNHKLKDLRPWKPAIEEGLLEPMRELAAPAVEDAGDTGAKLLTSALLPLERSDGAPPESLRARWTSCANQILLALEEEDLDRAEALRAQLEQLTAGIESSYVHQRVRLLAALVAYYRAPTGALVDELRQIGDELRDMGARGAEAQAIRFAAWAAARQGRTADYAALATRASTTIEQIAEELPPHERALYLLNKWSGRDELVAAKMQERLTAHGGPSHIPAAQLCQLFREIQALSEWPIDHAFGEHEATTIASAPVDRAERWVQQRLAEPAAGFGLHSPRSLWRLWPRTMVLHYHVHPDRTYLFRMTHRHLELEVLPLGRVHLAQVDLRREIDDEQTRAELAQRTGIAETLRRFPNLRRLVIVPHDAMANLPFAALTVDGQPLCQRVVLSQLDRLSRLRRRSFFHRRALPGVAIGLADYAGSGMPDLLRTDEEARQIAALLAPGSSLLTDRDATCEAALQALQTARRVHFAAHGVFSAEDPAASGVVLRDGSGHRVLTLRELRVLRDVHALHPKRSPLDLVTLATCRSAEAAVLPGGARICLPNAFLQAGARGVVASLWSLDDNAAAELMPAFYRALQTQRAASALATVQRDAAASGRWHPSDWAGLVFYGND